MFGLALTGVYSHADLAANKAGLAFYESLATSPNLTFDIRNHIGWSWNEQENPNYYGGKLHAMWLDNIPGQWAGTFTWNDDKTCPGAAINADLKIIGAKTYDDLNNNSSNIDGTYQYLYPKASYTSGVLTGKIAEITNSDGAVYRLALTVNWKEGTGEGKGALDMLTMYQLIGDWGRGSSANDGGSWTLHKLNT